MNNGRIYFDPITTIKEHIHKYIYLCTYIHESTQNHCGQRTKWH